MDTYFRALGANIGKDCCLFPAGGDPYMPEPDLVTIGDRVGVDMASIVCHLNTRGNFELNPIVLESHTTLRAQSRVQQGVVVEAGAMLLEKSLALTGEVMESGSIWQGAPALQICDYNNIASTTSVSASEKKKNYQDGSILTTRFIVEIVLLSASLAMGMTFIPSFAKQ
jgi:acetyltransferase-like isoleucine patch superfamily enzyme